MSLSNFAFIADDEVVVTIDDKEEEGRLSSKSRRNAQLA